MGGGGVGGGANLKRVSLPHKTKMRMSRHGWGGGGGGGFRVC